MSHQQSLFSPTVTEPIDHERTGGLDVAVDTTFGTAERVDLDETSWITHVPGWLTGDDELMRLLMTNAPWEQRSRWMYNRRVQEPRLTAEYPVVAQAPHPVLHHLTGELSRQFGVPYSRLWMNWYRDQDDGTSWHADRPVDRLDTAVIPVLSLGATRRFLIKPNGGGRSTVIVTRGGDLVVMGGRCQKDYKHSVPKQRTPAGPRLSLNFSPETAPQIA
ncbi:alpha-ketoglutarate-dependent dioxygenase AlkB [Pseudonocardia ailaonensis]